MKLSQADLLLLKTSDYRDCLDRLSAVTNMDACLQNFVPFVVVKNDRSCTQFSAEQTDLAPPSPNRIVVQLCFAREADDACTGICRTCSSAAPESTSIFPVFHWNNRHTFPLSP